MVAPTTAQSLIQLAFLPFATKLVPGRLLARRDRFIAEVLLDGETEPVRAHCVNPGRMEAFVEAGSRVYLSLAPERAKRKLRYTWELLEHAPAGTDTVLCGTNTQFPNSLVAALLNARSLVGLSTWASLKAEASMPAHAAGYAKAKGARAEPHGRCDFRLGERANADELVLSERARTPTSSRRASVRTHADADELVQSERAHWVEVKNAHMVYADGFAYFPDSVSERASRHVRHLAELVANGDAATVLFVVQRPDVLHGVRPSDHHDPLFAAACREAASAGVRFRAVRVSLSLDGASVEAEIPVDLAPYDPAPIAAQCDANSARTGWDRAFDGTYRRVANGPFPHNVPPKVRVPAPSRKRGRASVARDEAVQPPVQPALVD
jgi:sugar fermentation stimulation protein A